MGLVYESPDGQPTIEPKALKPPSVLLADDNPSVLEAISRMLSPEFEIVGVVTDGVSLVTEARRLRPDVMITDIVMPGLSGIEAARELKKHSVAGSIVFLTFFHEPSFVEEARSLGAMGYVLKSSADRDLIPAIHEALQGRFFQSSPSPH